MAIQTPAISQLGGATSANQTDGSQKTQIINTDNTGVNPASEDLAYVLRQLLDMLKSNAVVDVNDRQKVTIDAISIIGNTATGTPLSGSSSLLATTNFPTTLAPIQQINTSNWQPVWIGPVDQRFQIIDAADLTYNECIRSHLTFT